MQLRLGNRVFPKCPYPLIVLLRNIRNRTTALGPQLHQFRFDNLLNMTLPTLTYIQNQPRVVMRKRNLLSAPRPLAEHHTESNDHCRRSFAPTITPRSHKHLPPRINPRIYKRLLKRIRIPYIPNLKTVNQIVTLDLSTSLSYLRQLYKSLSPRFRSSNYQLRQWRFRRTLRSGHVCTQCRVQL